MSEHDSDCWSIVSGDASDNERAISDDEGFARIDRRHKKKDANSTDPKEVKKETATKPQTTSSIPIKKLKPFQGSLNEAFPSVANAPVFAGVKTETCSLNENHGRGLSIALQKNPDAIEMENFPLPQSGYPSFPHITGQYSGYDSTPREDITHTQHLRSGMSTTSMQDLEAWVQKALELDTNAPTPAQVPRQVPAPRQAVDLALDSSHFYSPSVVLRPRQPVEAVTPPAQGVSTITSGLNRIRMNEQNVNSSGLFPVASGTIGGTQTHSFGAPSTLPPSSSVANVASGANGLSQVPRVVGSTGQARTPSEQRQPLAQQPQPREAMRTLHIAPRVDLQSAYQWYNNTMTSSGVTVTSHSQLRPQGNDSPVPASNMAPPNISQPSHPQVYKLSMKPSYIPPKNNVQPQTQRNYYPMGDFSMPPQGYPRQQPPENCYPPLPSSKMAPQTYQQPQYPGYPTESLNNIYPCNPEPRTQQQAMSDVVNTRNLLTSMPQQPHLYNRDDPDRVREYLAKKVEYAEKFNAVKNSVRNSDVISDQPKLSGHGSSPVARKSTSRRNRYPTVESDSMDSERED